MSFFARILRRGQTSRALDAAVYLAAVPAACLGALLACNSPQDVKYARVTPPERYEPVTRRPQEPLPGQRASAPAGSAYATESLIDSVALSRLVTAVEPLGSGDLDESRGATVQAFRALAHALEALPAANAHTSVAMRQTADQIASSPPSSQEDADKVKLGLATGLAAFAGREPPIDHEAEYLDAKQTAQRAVDSIHADQPLLKQQEDVARAFRAATNLVAIAGNATAPFDRTEVITG